MFEKSQEQFVVAFLVVVICVLSWMLWKKKSEGMTKGPDGRLFSELSKGLVSAGADIRFDTGRTDGSGGDRVKMEAMAAKRSHFAHEPPVFWGATDYASVSGDQSSAVREGYVASSVKITDSQLVKAMKGE